MNKVSYIAASAFFLMFINVELSIAQVSADRNFTSKNEIKIPAITTQAQIDALAVDSKNQMVNYVDGLGRPLQSVNLQNTPNKRDIITPVEYDAFGREVKKFLPYADEAGSTYGSIRSTVYADQLNFYSPTNTTLLNVARDNSPYNQVFFEFSPLSRILEQGQNGNTWQPGSGYGTSSIMGFNTAAENVRKWTVAATAGSLPTSASAYLDTTLFKITTTDERKNLTIEYKDREGKTILKKVQLAGTPGIDHTGWLCTYYIYDDFNNLRFVLQPKAIELIGSNWSTGFTQAIADEFSFRYEYDQRRRMIIKKIPGAGETWMVYDAADRMVMTQDANLRAITPTGKWMVTEYDNENRPWRNGLLTDANNRTTHQANAYNVTNYPNTTGSNYEVLAQTYYDDYAWTSVAGLSSTIDATNTSNSVYFITTYNASPYYAQPISPSYQVRGLATGSMTKVLGSSPAQYLYKLNFYDDHGRVIQTQAINFTGGKDVTSTQYDFNGKPIRSLLVHQKSGSNPQTHFTLTKMEYDHANRLKKIWKNLENTSDQLIDSIQYNEIGQLRAKWLGNNVDSLVYDYNIRGWMADINKTYLQNSTNNYFGMELGYDQIASSTNAPYNNAQFNGNISGTIWKSKGDGVGRKYDFLYDNVNRLQAGNFTQNTTGTAWDSSYINYGVSNLSYDANGNILSMNQKGFKVGGSSIIDQLTYTYQSNSNKLSQVNDAANDAGSKLGDFHFSGTKQATDYSYDLNGNLILDNNKAISTISYNYLNLPQQTTITAKGNIAYTYDAGGSKLKKVTTDNTIVPAKITTTLYIGPFVYQNDTLQFEGHEEGRTRWAWHKYYTLGTTGYNFEYDFFEKDHLGNVRTILTQQKDTTQYLATMEAAYRATESQLFGGITTTSYKRASVPSYPNDLTFTNPNDSVSRLNGNPSLGQKTGPNLLLKVMGGDKIDMMVQYFFNSGTTSTPTSYVTDVLGSLATGIVNMTAGGHGSLADLNNTTTSPIYYALNSFVAANDATPTGKPKAYLNWILLDDQFKYVSSYPQSGAIPVVTAGPSGTALQSPLGITGIPITKNGYLYIWVSNETPGWDVFFDNLSVKQYTGPLLEETHFYPFGLTMAAISDKAIKTNYAQNKFRFNGKELQNQEFTDGSGLEEYDFGARFQDPQLGVWHNIDPKGEKTWNWSPYTQVLDNPIHFFDPNGMETEASRGDERRSDEVEGGHPVTLGGNDINTNDKSYKNAVAQVIKSNKKNAKNAPPALAFTLAVTKGTVGVKGKVLNTGYSMSASHNEKDVVGMRDNKSVNKESVRNGMEASIHGFGGEVSVESKNPLDANGNVPDEHTTELKVSAPLVSLVQTKDEKNVTTYSGTQTEIFSLKVGAYFGLDISATINIPSVSSVSAPPTPGVAYVSDNTRVVINIPDFKK